MSFRFRGSRPPLPLFVYAPDGPIRPDKARSAAWARALELGPRYTIPGRKPTRADLPDVDFSRASPVPRKPMPAFRLWRAVFKDRVPLPSADRADTRDGPVAENDGPPHMIDEPVARQSTSVRHGFKNVQEPRRAA